MACGGGGVSTIAVPASNWWAESFPTLPQTPGSMRQVLAADAFLLGVGGTFPTHRRRLHRACVK